MGINKSIDAYTVSEAFTMQAPPKGWRFVWPNTADFNFNYYKLLKDAENTGIGNPPMPMPRIAEPALTVDSKSVEVEPGLVLSAWTIPARSSSSRRTRTGTIASATRS